VRVSPSSGGTDVVRVCADARVEHPLAHDGPFRWHLLMRAAPERAGVHNTPAIANLFTADEPHRLIWLRGAVAAEPHLVPHDQPCPEHQACRRLAFALWLSATHRLSEGDQP